MSSQLVFTRSEAISFLKYTLRIDDVDTKVKGPKLDLLQEITRKFYEQIPFQNLSLLSHLKTRHLPTEEEIKSDYFSGIGGLPYTSAIFGESLLKTLGYDTFLVAISMCSTDKFYTHVAFVVKDIVTTGERFLVDLGAGYPTFEPIPLHFLPLYYKQAFLEYKFVRQQNGLIVRYHKIGCFFQLDNKVQHAPTTSDGWKKFYEFEEIARSDEFIKRYQGPIYSVVGFGSGWATTSLRMTIYPASDEAYIVNEFELKKWKKGKKVVEAVSVGTMPELQHCIQNYFPTLNDVELKEICFSSKKKL